MWLKHLIYQGSLLLFEAGARGGGCWSFSL
jgi:hypothetical protein